MCVCVYVTGVDRERREEQRVSEACQCSVAQHRGPLRPRHKPTRTPQNRPHAGQTHLLGDAAGFGLRRGPEREAKQRAIKLRAAVAAKQLQRRDLVGEGRGDVVRREANALARVGS